MKPYKVFLIFLGLLALFATYNYLFPPKHFPKNKDSQRATYISDGIRQYLLDSRDSNLENIYSKSGKKFEFKNGESKWYELLEFLTQEVYSLEKDKYGPYFKDYFNDAEDIINKLSPEYYPGYCVVILSREKYKKAPLVYSYPCKKNKDNVIKIIYSEDEFLNIVQNH